MSGSEAFWTIGLTCQRLLTLSRKIVNDIIYYPLPLDFEDQSEARLHELLKVKGANKNTEISCFEDILIFARM